MRRRVAAAAAATSLALLVGTAQGFVSGAGARAPAASTLLRPLHASGKGFGASPAPRGDDKKPEEPAAKKQVGINLGELAAKQREKLLPKQGQDGKESFGNPAVGDFQVFDALVKYPTWFTIKAIGVEDGTFASDLRAAVANVLEQDPEKVKISTREKGKYQRYV